MKKVYVLVAALVATFGALSMGSASFAAPTDSVPPDDTVQATDDTVPATDTAPTTAAPTTAAPTTAAPTTAAPTTAAPTTIAATTIASTAAPTTAALGVTESSAEVGQEAPTSTTRRVGSDGLLPNTGGDMAIPLILAGLAAGTGAATLLVRRRSNVS
jgi:LPXTG-motif cell wall-anchored protein